MKVADLRYLQRYIFQGQVEEPEDQALPFHEVVNVKLHRLVGGAVTAFIAAVAKAPPSIGTKWSASIVCDSFSLPNSSVAWSGPF